ncbi:MAG TPA: hypothetical protein VFG68_06160 [Fimbriiglobus sp.]|nr:hypothetical protein [Fimbriiglobus sp.]
MPVLFAATLFVSASLLFMVQPMVGKMILPLLGGSPAVWNTCMVFFQALLLLGYLYAHHVTSKYKPARQAAVHLGVLGVAIGWMVLAAVLSPSGAPVAVFKSLAPQGQSYPMFGVMALLAVAIGLPFLVVSTSAPLLQKWFAYTGHPSAKDPYFLYAASNAGSLIALLGYPLMIEPSLTLASQAWVWAGGFVLLMGLVYLCGQAASSPLRPVPKRKPAPTARPGTPAVADPTAPTTLQKLRWLALAFVPSSLMLGVTFHMTTDIASVPLLWVIPLALYLLTFIIAFGRTPSWFRPVIANLSPVLTLLLVFVLTSKVTSRDGFTAFMALSIHIVVYFFTALLMHSELARDRPDPRHLTGYYLWMSLGGVLGGVFNALIAPVFFHGAYEYPITIAVGCLLIPSLSDDAEPRPVPVGWRRWRPVMLDVLIPLAMLCLISWLTVLPEQADWFVAACGWVAEKITAALQFCGLSAAVSYDTIRLLSVYAVPCVLCFFFIDRPVRFGLCVAAVLAVGYYRAAQAESTVMSARSFFGILHVENYGERDGLLRFDSTDPADGTVRHLARPFDFWFYRLLHGTTLHGMQATESTTFPVVDDVKVLGAMSPWNALLTRGAQTAWDFRQEPLTYYHRTGPVGKIFHRFRAIDPTGDVAMVGLGSGTVAAYARPGQKLTFYEIDPTVIALVEHPRVMNPEEVAKGEKPLMGPFTYLADARRRGATIELVLGDARLKLEEQTDRRYGLLLVDAFSSDSIPVHLLTREALLLYKDRLTEHGLLALHISNRYIDLEPVVGLLAKETGLVARVFSDRDQSPPGKTLSSWVVLAKNKADLGDEILGENSDERYGAVAGGFGHNIFDNARYDPPVFVFPWQELRTQKNLRPWTDDYSDVLAVMNMREIQWLRRHLGMPTATDE